MSAWPAVQISPRGAQQIRAGSLWVFANEFQTKVKTLQPGQWVEFHCQGEFVGYGYVNPNSLITGRICSREPVTSRKELFDRLITRALDKRGSLKSVGSFRGVFSESDSMPGLIVDVYGDKEPIVVAQTNTWGMDEARGDWQQSLHEILKPSGLVVRGDSSIRNLEGAKQFNEVITGDEAKLSHGEAWENGVGFAADFVNGQKTGFFLDQRDNRGFLKSHARGLKVLDLFSYSGGWGLSALKGGALEATFVDQSDEALGLVARGLDLNKFDKKSARLVTQDVFDFLEADRGRYDVVVCDPPAFVKSRKNLPQAIKAYKKLNRQALSKVNPGGIFLTCSCSFHLSEQDFTDLVTEVVQASGRTGEVIHRGTQPADHPWILNRPESRYLKCLGLRLN